MRPGRKANHSLPSNAEVKECVELYLHSPDMPSWHDTQLSAGTALPLHLCSPEKVHNSSFSQQRIEVVVFWVDVPCS